MVLVIRAALRDSCFIGGIHQNLPVLCLSVNYDKPQSGSDVQIHFRATSLRRHCRFGESAHQQMVKSCLPSTPWPFINNTSRISSCLFCYTTTAPPAQHSAFGITSSLDPLIFQSSHLLHSTVNRNGWRTHREKQRCVARQP
jgi:hypothetical protein